MIGLLASGSYITMLIGRFVSHFTNRPVTLPATKRISFMPKRTFRAVGGIVLALFAGCFDDRQLTPLKNIMQLVLILMLGRSEIVKTAVISLESGTEQLSVTANNVIPPSQSLKVTILAAWTKL